MNYEFCFDNITVGDWLDMMFLSTSAEMSTPDGIKRYLDIANKYTNTDVFKIPLSELRIFTAQFMDGVSKHMIGSV